MPLPLTQGSDPEEVTILANGWTMVAQNVQIARVNNLYQAETVVWMTYVGAGGAAPVGLDVPKWRVPEDWRRLRDGFTARDVYVYPEDADIVVVVEA